MLKAEKRVDVQLISMVNPVRLFDTILRSYESRLVDVPVVAVKLYDMDPTAKDDRRNTVGNIRRHRITLDVRDGCVLLVKATGDCEAIR